MFPLSGCNQEINNTLNSVIWLMVSGLDFAFGMVAWLGTVVEERVGQGTTDALVKECHQQGSLSALVGKPIAISLSVAFQ